MNWKRYRLCTRSVEDERPLIFNERYPWWCTGYGEDSQSEYAVIVVYLPENEDVYKYWDDAFNIDFEEREDFTFTSRFPKPEWLIED